MKLTKDEIAEIKDLYDGSSASVRELAGLFGTTINTIKYLVNYKGYRDWYKNWIKEWRKKNPEKYKATYKKANLKWRKNNIERYRTHQRAYQKRRYWLNKQT